MSLGLAKDSMLNLAEMAKKVEDGEYKTSVEYTEGEREELIPQLTKVGSARSIDLPDNNKDDDVVPEYGDADESSFDDENAETKTEEDWDDEYNEKASVTSSSIDSDTGLAASPQATPKDATNPVTNPTSSTIGRYSGFDNSNSSEYDDYYTHGDYYSAYNTAKGNGDIIPSLIGSGNGGEKISCWSCLFPWLTGDRMVEVNADVEEEQPKGNESIVLVPETSNHTTTNDDERSTSSDMFGERLSDKDRQAVLARLRLAQPDVKEPSPPESPEKAKKTGLFKDIPEQSSQPIGKPKSILKTCSKLSRSNQSLNSSANGQDSSKRRSLFPQYSGPSKAKQDLNISFSPMARVLSVKSHKEMDDAEKGAIWWQKSDYEGFRKTGRMITKAMLEGGSEIWLATNRSWQIPNQGRSSTLKQATSLAERRQAAAKDELAKKEYEEARDKWWHKFGHSRRGLEHIASIDEGRQRQANVRQAIRAVVEENRRQKAFMREDADKLRMVSLQHTTWARDLAMAAGASDADAVKMNFNDESRKSREFYLLKFLRAQQNASIATAPKTNTATVPAFMRPARSLTVKPNRLDANTISQIRYRQKKKVAPLPSSSSSSSDKDGPVAAPKEEKESSSSSSSSMAKKAAGFASGEEVANMSAVLSGMGPLPKSAATVGGP
eukprot:scaffold4891_cov140-Cylindrotheca_fusiformis.AAC.11